MNKKLHINYSYCISVKSILLPNYTKFPKLVFLTHFWKMQAIFGIKKNKNSSSGAFSKNLVELENCGFIIKYIPFVYHENNYIYQPIDNYTLFYYKFLKENHFEENFCQNQINNQYISI